MKLRQSEKCAVLLAVLFIALIFGYSLGKGDTSGRFSITQQYANGPDTPAPELQEIDAVLVFVLSAENPININTADEALLTELPGVGQTLAARIIDHREEHGGFEEIEDITAVYGIGSGLFERMRDYITTGDVPADDFEELEEKPEDSDENFSG